MPEQGRLLAERLPPGHIWSYREELATSRLHRGAQSAAEVVLAATDPQGVLLADGNCATPLVWHMCAVQNRPHYQPGPPEVTEELLAAVQEADYDLVFITAPDLAWVADGVRDDPSGREAAFHHYRDLYPLGVVVSGTEREQFAKGVVSRLIGGSMGLWPA